MKFGAVSLQTYFDPLWTSAWTPTSSLGQSGSILVQTGGSDLPRGRTVTLTQTVSMPAGVLFEDAGNSISEHPYYELATVWWETNYNADRMRFQVVWRRAGIGDTIIFSQAQSGLAYTDFRQPSIGFQAQRLLPGDQLVMQVVAVPEPGSLSILGLALGAVIALGRRLRSC